MLENRDAAPPAQDGNVIAGRYLLGDPAKPGDALRVTDLGQPERDVELALWPLGPSGWPREGARLKSIALLSHPSLSRLVDFGRADSDQVFAVAESVGRDRLELALREGRVDALAAVRDVVTLALALRKAGLPQAALDAEALRVKDGLVRLSTLALARPHVAAKGLGDFARAVLDAADTVGLLGKVLKSWTRGAGPSLAEAEAGLKQLGVDLESGSPAAEAEMVGREVESALLERKLADLLEAGRGAVVAVTGAAASGKSRLLRQFGFAARAAGITYLEASASVPSGVYGPVASLVRQLARFAPQPYLWRHGRDLALIAPDVGLSLAAPRPYGTEPEAMRLRLLESVSRLVREVAVSRPLVLRLANLHLADEAAIGLLRPIAVDVARNPEGYGCLLALEVRTPVDQGALGAPVDQGALGALLADLRRAPGCTELPLAPLAADDVRRLLVAVAGPGKVSAAAADRVRLATGGTAGLVLAAARDLAAKGGGGETDPGESLSPAETEVARALAVLGRPASERVVAAVSGLASASAALAALVRKGLVRAVDDRSDAFEVADPSVRAGLLKELARKDLERMHARAALADLAPAEVVRHLEAAGEVVKARDAALAAARAARSAHAYHEAYDLLRSALERAATAAERAGLLREAADVAALAGETLTAARWLEELQAFEGGHNPATVLERARLLAERGAADQALEVLEALRTKASGDDHLGARVAVLRARALLRRGEHGEAEAEARSAKRLLNRLAGLPHTLLDLALADHVLAAVAQAKGDLQAALRLEQAALARLGEGAAPERRVTTLSRVGNIHFARGELDLALGRYEEALRLAEKHDYSLGVAEVIGNMGAVLFNRGDVEGARRHFSRSLDLRERVGDATGAVLVLSNLGLVAAAEGRFDDGRRLFAQAEEGAARLPGFSLAFNEMALGLLESEAERPEQAVHHLRASVSLWCARSDRRGEAIARAVLAEALVRKGDLADARAEAESALDLGKELKAAEPQGLALRALALVAARKKLPRLQSPERYFQASLKAFEQESNLFEAEKTLRLLGETLRDHALPGVSRSLAARASRAASPEPLPVLSGSVQADRKNLRLLVEALLVDRGGGEAAALARVAEAAEARWAVLVLLSSRDGDPPPASVVAVHGKPPEGMLEKALETARTALRSSPRPPASAQPLGRGEVLSLPLVLPGSTRPSGFVLLARRKKSGAAPLGVLEALARPLRSTLARANLHRPERRLRAHGDGFGGIVGRTPPMRKLFSLLERVVTNELPVLIQGESGTGKELVARAIHDASSRRDGPFIPIDCAAIPESLIESELFGHKRGAFTGTAADRVGLFEEGTGGTVFLDEATNIPLPVQAKLLRVLQEREVRRVGDTVLRPIDVRVIAATNRPLEAAVREGSFREDLYFRLHVIEIVLPALRERRDDIPLLVEHFLARLADPSPRIDRATIDRLLQYDWPGNVRELENEMRRAFALARGLIRETDLSPVLLDAKPRVLATSGVPPLHEAVSRLERELIERALIATGYHRGKTARMLGLSHQGLINKVKKYRIRASARGKTIKEVDPRPGSGMRNP